MQYYAGAPGCPEGFAPVATAAGVICAYRGHAPCLGGQTDEFGHFVCTDYDFSCPPGMSTHHGSPSNWCYREAATPSAHMAGLDLPGSDFLHSLGHAIPEGVDSLGHGIADFFHSVPSPIDAAKKYGQEALEGAARAAAKEAATQFPAMPDVDAASRRMEKSSHELNRGMKAAAAIFGVAILGASIIYVLGKK